jgi:WD40 repeat protein
MIIYLWYIIVAWYTRVSLSNQSHTHDHIMSWALVFTQMHTCLFLLLSSFVVLSPDGTKSPMERMACVWSLSTGKRALRPLEHEGALVTAARFSPNGCLSRAMILFVYDSQKGHLLVDVPIRVNSRHNRSLGWASDSKELFALSHDGIVHCLDISTKKTRPKWRIHSSNDPECIDLASNCCGT